MTDGASAPRLGGYHREVVALRVMAEWEPQAACAPGLLPAWIADGFFLDTSRLARDRLAVEEARSVCRSCPVQVDCLEHALATAAQGVWGGTTGKEREGIVRSRRRQARRRG